MIPCDWPMNRFHQAEDLAAKRRKNRKNEFASDNYASLSGSVLFFAIFAPFRGQLALFCFLISHLRRITPVLRRKFGLLRKCSAWRKLSPVGRRIPS